MANRPLKLVVALFAAAVMTVAAAACGSDNEDATAVPPAGAETQTAAGGSGPPGADVRLRVGQKALATGSYCWSGEGKATCADSLPPSARNDLPLLRIQEGDDIKFFFRFEPTRVRVELLGQNDRRISIASVPASIESQWTVTREAGRASFILVRAEAELGDVTYVGRLARG